MFSLEVWDGPENEGTDEGSLLNLSTSKTKTDTDGGGRNEAPCDPRAVNGEENGDLVINRPVEAEIIGIMIYCSKQRKTPILG